MSNDDTNLPEVLTKPILALANTLEHEGEDGISVELSRIMRNVRVAATQDIEVNSWEEFQSFILKNLGSDLVFRFGDQFGQDDPKTAELAEIVKAEAALMKRLHDLYLKLKGETAPPDSGVAAPEEALSSLEGDDTPAAEGKAE